MFACAQTDASEPFTLVSMQDVVWSFYLSFLPINGTATGTPRRRGRRKEAFRHVL